MGDISCPNTNGNGNGIACFQRKSCWYEEEIEENLRWCFALNRSVFFYNSIYFIIRFENYIKIWLSSAFWLKAFV